MTDISRLTRAIRAGLETDSQFGAVVPPLYLSTTYSFEGLGSPRRYDYSRSGNPTRTLLAEALTTLEGGGGAVVTNTGTSAMTNVVTYFLRPGDRLLYPHDCYGGSWRLFESLHARGLLVAEPVDFTDPAAVDAALATPATVVWLETPSNPLLRLTDIADVTAKAKAVGATVVADNTFLTPLLQRPLEYGVDVVVHSTTKYINGHSDIVAGAVVAADENLAEELTTWANVLGVTGSPFDSYQTLRGLRSLHTRLKAHEENAAAVADLFASHPAVATTYYPGLADHPGHDIATRQQDGFGGMVSADLAGGEAAVRAFVTGLRCFSLAESLGGTESLVDHPASMTHVAMTPEARALAGIGDGLLRFSVGIEHVDDLVADLRAALDRAAAA
ncbi:cystathionine gamma-synthase [Agilicoccus flavus]|uniref:cystathionine gamma-synthase n=1 Tax=Agilicoccus flavus TaxID=2775968 RepID=UPI001CF62535|nr:cystathionine gamma-synthase [Agilicoccus flavus]